MINENTFFVTWDKTSSVFQQVDREDKKTSRPDTIIYARHRDGSRTEVGNIEIKPERAAQSLVYLDRIKMLETAKRQLHMRLIKDNEQAELRTFAILIHGNQVEQYVVYFRDRFYGYTRVSQFSFPSSADTVDNVRNALQLLSGFKELIRDTIRDPVESPSLFATMRDTLIPTIAACVRKKVIF